MKKSEKISYTTNETLLRDKTVDAVAESEFDRVDPHSSNFEIILQALTPEVIRYIVDYLIYFESDFRGFGEYQTDNFVHDRDIPALYISVTEKFGSIPQPSDPYDLQRWAFLICVSAAIIDGFSYGNVIVPSLDIDRQVND